MSQLVVSPPLQEPKSRKPLDERQRAMRITRVIRKAEQRLRRRHEILNRQNLLGTLIFIVSAVGFIASSALYLQGLIPAWACVLLNAFFASLLHELEHDLIHNLYFRTRPVLQNAMMLGVWAFRCNTINPWYRRHLHLLHHKESGQHTDIEERLLGNGMPLGLSRVISTFDVFIGSLLRWGELTKVPACSPRGLILAGVPFMALFWCTWYVWLVYHGATLAAGQLGAPASLALLVAGRGDGAEQLGGCLRAAQRVAAGLPKHYIFQHALLRRRGRVAAPDASAQRLVFVAVAVVLLQLWQHPRHSPLWSCRSRSTSAR